MANSILGASGLGKKDKTGTPPGTPPARPLDQTGPTAPPEGQIHTPELADTGGKGHIEPAKELVKDILPDVPRNELAPTTPPRPRRAKRAEAEPQTIYFGEGELERAADLAHLFKKSGRFKGLVRGHVGVSLVIRTALDLLNEEYKHDAAAALDRGVRVASRGVR